MADRYFQEELRYLTEAAKEFAQAHPEQARLLNIDSITDRDPYVERLFEGFAFLAGRVREKLDDEFPEFLRGLFEILNPQALRVVPSFAMLEFRPRAGMLQGCRRVEAGVSVQSNPVGPENARCRFRTCYPVDLFPIELSEVQQDRGPGGEPAIRFKFLLSEGIEYAKLDLKQLRIYVHADPSAAYQLHHALTRDVEQVLHLPSRTRLGAQNLVRPGGFADSESILPAARSTHPAYRLLQEYFSFREKFHFVDFSGFDRLTVEKGVREISLLLVLKRPLAEGLKYSAAQFRLYCTPIVNHFEHDAEPLRVDHTRFRYRVLANSRQPRSYEISDVLSVRGIEMGTGKQRNYARFDEFRFDEQRGERTFSSSCEIGPSEHWECHLSLHGIEPSEAGPQPENLSISTYSTNGALPRELNENQITVPADDSPSVAAFGNLTKPTLPLYPPRRDLYQWRLLSGLAHNHLSLDNVDNLRSLLELYDWTGLDANSRRIRGIQSIKVTPHDWLTGGSILRGAMITVELNETHYSGKGDAHIFSLTLREFFRRYVTINSLIELRVTLLPSQEIYSWPPDPGTQILL